jgi:protein phosphatase
MNADGAGKRPAVVRAAGWSERGPVRTINEDCLAIDDELQLYVVADGMGGHNAGEIASRLAVEALVGFMRRSLDDSDFSWPYGIDPALSHDGNRLRTAIHLANARVYRAGQSRPDYHGMGTTVVTALVSGSQVIVGHVGDSRLYVAGPGSLLQLTRDDSWTARVLADEAGLDAEARARHPYRHVLTSVLGAAERIEVHLAERQLQGGETLLLCSDGLHGPLSDAALQELLDDKSNDPDDLTALARRLAQAAIDRGGCGNITALLVVCL